MKKPEELFTNSSKLTNKEISNLEKISNGKIDISSMAKDELKKLKESIENEWKGYKERSKNIKSLKWIGNLVKLSINKIEQYIGEEVSVNEFILKKQYKPYIKNNNKVMIEHTYSESKVNETNNSVDIWTSIPSVPDNIKSWNLVKVKLIQRYGGPAEYFWESLGNYYNNKVLWIDGNEIITHKEIHKVIYFINNPDFLSRLSDKELIELNNTFQFAVWAYGMYNKDFFDPLNHSILLPATLQLCWTIMRILEERKNKYPTLKYITNKIEWVDKEDLTVNDLYTISKMLDKIDNFPYPSYGDNAYKQRFSEYVGTNAFENIENAFRLGSLINKLYNVSDNLLNRLYLKHDTVKPLPVTRYYWKTWLDRVKSTVEGVVTRAFYKFSVLLRPVYGNNNKLSDFQRKIISTFEKFYFNDLESNPFGATLLESLGWLPSDGKKVAKEWFKESEFVNKYSRSQFNEEIILNLSEWYDIYKDTDFNMAQRLKHLLERIQKVHQQYNLSYYNTYSA